MVKNPIVVTSLEEDFKKIGLIKEAAEVETETDESSSDMEEARRVKIALRGGKKTRQQRTSAKQRLMGKKYRRSASGKKASRRRARLMKKPSMQRRMKRVAAKAERLGTRQESVALVKNFDRAEALKSIANAAIISEKLADYFEECVSAPLAIEEANAEGEAETIAAIAGVCTEMAELLADMATELHEGNVEGEEPAIFNECLDFILEAVELYEAMKAEEEEMDDEEEEMDDEEEDDSEDME